MNLGLSETCIYEAEQYKYVLQMFIATHVICFTSNVSREFFSTDIGMCGSIMRIVEVLCVPLYIYALVLNH